jgi:excisionase family DNA binding protein
MSESISTTTTQATPEGLWTPQQVADFLKVSRSWVYQKAEAGLIPVIRMPGSSLLRFEPGKIQAYARGEWAPVKVLPFRPVSTKG